MDLLFLQLVLLCSVCPVLTRSSDRTASFSVNGAPRVVEKVGIVGEQSRTVPKALMRRARSRKNSHVLASGIAHNPTVHKALIRRVGSRKNYRDVKTGGVIHSSHKERQNLTIRRAAGLRPIRLHPRQSLSPVLNKTIVRGIDASGEIHGIPDVWRHNAHQHNASGIVHSFPLAGASQSATVWSSPDHSDNNTHGGAGIAMLMLKATSGSFNASPNASSTTESTTASPAWAEPVLKFMFQPYGPIVLVLLAMTITVICHACCIGFMSRTFRGLV